MRTVWEIRLLEPYVDLVVSPTEGRRVGPGGTVRQVFMSLDDPRVGLVKEVQERVRRDYDKFLYFGWNLTWKYTNSELRSAELFCLELTPPFEPCGEQCGTEYDESAACSHCGHGRRQTSDLVLDLRKIPKSRDITSSLGNEWVVSQRLAELLVKHNMTGFELAPIRHKARYRDDPWDPTEVPAGRRLLNQSASYGIKEGSWEYMVWLNTPEIRPLVEAAHDEYVALKERNAAKSKNPLPVWYQLKVTACVGETASQTKFGLDPVNEDVDEQFICPHCHRSGLNILSEVFLPRGQYSGTDFAITKNKYGMCKGVLVPKPILLVSPRVFWLLKEHKMRAFESSVAHLI